ncbi:MAG: metal-dependent phosphohydrolase [Thermodesulfobacteriota bacterium]
MQGLDRRQFLRLSALTGATVAAAAVIPRFSLAEVKKASLTDCLNMSPQEMAERSKLVMDSWAYLRKGAESIRGAKLRGQVFGILDNPAPTFTSRMMDAAHRKATYDQLVQAGFLKDVALEAFLPRHSDPNKSPQPFLSAPGSGYQSHHSYPGGLVTHTALNVKVSLALYEGYKETYGYELDRDVVVASQVLHDLHKPWVFQWGPSGESRTELSLAGTGEHHPYSVAESIYRGLPPVVIVAQACAHEHPGTPRDEKGPVNWIKAASILAGVDPVGKGLLAQAGDTLPLPRRQENFVCHLGDHDWVLSVPAAKWIIPVMKEIAAEKYGLPQTGGDENEKVKKFNALRNYVFSQATIMHLYQVYGAKGKQALTEMVTSIVVPA